MNTKIKFEINPDFDEMFLASPVRLIAWIIVCCIIGFVFGLGYFNLQS